MKRIILSLVLVVGTIFASIAYTRAAWTDTVTVTNNIITTGTVDLEVSTDSGTTWDSTTASSTMTLSNLAPGAAATSAYSFSLRNSGTVGPMTLSAQVTSTNITPTAGVDKSMLYLTIYDTDTLADVSAEVTMLAWESGLQALTTTLPSGGTPANFGIRARLDTTADNTWQGQTVTFTLSVTGTQP